MITMNIKKLIGVNKNINNIIEIAVPYWRLVGRSNEMINQNSDSKMVIFFGDDMSGIVKSGIIGKGLYIAKINEYLGFVRERFKGYDLYYKPHPSDLEEQFFLDLNGFKIIQEKTTSELFLWKNRWRIKATFSVGSFSSFNAYNMGLNSYVFYKCFSGIYPPSRMWSFDSFYLEMPKSFFISNLSQEILDNSRTLKEDKLLEINLKNILSQNTGKIWLICSFSESIVVLSILSEFIKSIDCHRRVGLIINRGHRWDIISTDYFKDYFDEIVFFPRIFYSLRPARLWQAVKIARQIKNFDLAPGDVLMAASFPEFIENCFISYHKKNIKIGFLMSRDFNLMYNPHNTLYTQNNNFRFDKAAWFYNKIFEPLLGLNRTIYMACGCNKSYANRYQKPINELYEKIYVMNSVVQ